MFCHQCGSTASQQWEGLCKNCFLKQYPLLSLEADLQVNICSNCHAQFQEGKWIGEGLPEEEIIYQTLEKNIKVSSLVEDPEIDLEILQMRGSIAECMIIARGKVLGEELTQEYETSLRLDKTVCPDCSKFAAGYYESVIQLRADSRSLYPEEIGQADEIIKENLNRLQEKNRMAYLSQRIKIKEGIDYYIGSQKVARKLVHKIREILGGFSQESPRLMGQDKSSGKDLYRTWISLRLPEFSIDDFISFKDRFAQVKSLDSRKIVVKDVSSLEKFSIPWKDYPAIEKLASFKDIQKTTLTAKTPKLIQLLHPTTYETIEVQSKPDFEELDIGDQVKVIDLKGKIYIIVEKNRKRS